MIDHDSLAVLAVKIAHLEDEVSQLERKYVRIERYINIERAVLGIIGLIATSLVAYAMSRLLH